MNRTYEKHNLRETISLSGQWDIYFDEDDSGLDRGFHSDFPDDCQPIQIPSCWNFKDGRYEYNGVAWLRKRLHSSQSSAIYLTFDAASGYKQVWLDSELLGDHYGSFTDFSFLTYIAEGPHELIVRIDNRHDDTTLPRPYVDWKTWGGIYRPVEYSHVKDVVISRVFADVIWDGYTPEAISLRVKTINSIGKDMELPCSVYFGEDEVFAVSVRINADGGEIQLGEFSVGDVELWSPENPKLYSIRIVCGSDDLIEKIGFRKIEADRGKILLNGEAIKMLGINRHHTHQAHGFAIPPSLSERDMDILDELNVNALRGSHYPNEPFFLDLCDQRGMLFWEELPFWQHPPESLGNPILRKRAMDTMKEMIERDYNHPSIIFWSLQNESSSDSPEGKELFGELAALARGLDETRLITMATNRQYDDLCYEFVDVIGVNCYHGWYGGTKPEQWVSELGKLKEHLRSNGFGDKPLMITEFGASAYIGERGFERQRRFSEEYQADLLEYIINLLSQDDEIAGMYIWQFCDMRTAKWYDRLERPRCFNSKGILDENRRPKLAYRKVKELYGKFDSTKYPAQNAVASEIKNELVNVGS